MRIVTTDLENRLEQNEHNLHPIQGICWYNILANTIYQQRFAYISAALEDGIKRSEMIVDGDDDNGNNDEQSDLVSIVLNLALIDDDIVQKLRIGEGMSE